MIKTFVCYGKVVVLLAVLLYGESEGAALRLANNNNNLEGNGKASFSYVGMLVPHTKTVEIAFTYDFVSAENLTRATFNGLVDQVAEFKAKYPTSLQEHQELDRLLGKGQRELNHQLLRLEQLTGPEVNKRAWYDSLGVVASLIQGWSNSRHVSTLAGNEHILHHEVEVNRGLLAKASNQTKELQGLALEALQFERVASTLTSVTENLINDVKERIEAVYAASQGSLHPLFGPEELLETALDHARSIGKNESLVPVFNTVISLLRAPISLVLGSQAAGVLVHVPMHDETTEPMRLFHLESAQVIRQYEVEKLVVDRMYLAEDTKGWRVSLSDGELLKCRRSGITYLCDSQRELHRGTFDCVSSLYDGSAETKWCESTVVPHSEDYVVPLGGNLYYGRAKEATLHCQDGSSKKLDWTELAFKTVQAQCWVTTPSFLILSNHKRYLEKGKTVSIQAPMGAGNFNALPGSLDGGIEKFDDFHSGWNTTHVEKLTELDYTMEYLLYGFLGVAALVVVLFLGLAFLFKYVTKNKTAAVIATGAAGMATGNPLLMESAVALLSQQMARANKPESLDNEVEAEDASDDAALNETHASMEVNLSSGTDSGVSSHNTTRDSGRREDIERAAEVGAQVAKACRDAHPVRATHQSSPEEYVARRRQSGPWPPTGTRSGPTSTAPTSPRSTTSTAGSTTRPPRLTFKLSTP